MHHHVWFETKYANDDRIISQMSLAAPLVPRPPNVGDKRGAKTPKPALKTILLFNGLPKFVKPGQVQFLSEDCPVKTCYLTGDKKDSSKADAVVLGGRHPHTPSVKPQGQVWVMWGIESPKYWQMPVTLGDRINWTATYRHDSTIVTPYEKYVPHKYGTLKQGTLKNYASGKQKKVAWFASRCKSNNKREDYVKELAKYIEVDIYGPCGSKTCPKFSAECYNMLSNDYKFYLSFENSNCRDYITEKFFVNGLGNDVIPIAMGAHPDDYKRAAPPHSYIHVEDFRSAKELAEYLHKLDKNDHLYNEYFRWKGSMKKINTHFFCRLCAMVHEAENHRTWYKDIREWWGGEGVCRTEQRWTDGEPHF
ncbi:glycoprotein 3-alpha-L-fucosyltransferase A [Lingula anatina]|uniref:Fucosyltransferase n=1 Tax=Lingula anatina TaxID=7574 RepID=A0A1S3JCY3_LINAN|nr:glycoprotein 3-alpha-L-fucosyltransferase A [Lingula anatina]|eukprot:XP_013408275.1 glycoprotein 3-alpha-L-fucosyltransferase A [Lingula anatina]